MVVYSLKESANRLSLPSLSLLSSSRLLRRQEIETFFPSNKIKKKTCSVVCSFSIIAALVSLRSRSPFSLLTLGVKGPAGNPHPLLVHPVSSLAPPRCERSTHARSIVSTALLYESSVSPAHSAPTAPQQLYETPAEQPTSSSRSSRLSVPALLAIVGASRTSPSPSAHPYKPKTHTRLQCSSSSLVPRLRACTCAAGAWTTSAPSTASARRSSRRCTGPARARTILRMAAVARRRPPSRCRRRSRRLRRRRGDHGTRSRRTLCRRMRSRLSLSPLLVV